MRCSLHRSAKGGDTAARGAALYLLDSAFDSSQRLAETRLRLLLQKLHTKIGGDRVKTIGKDIARTACPRQLLILV
tara:strand:- start:128 stop:355 length:228 start_codon:yes stop_codon:yes gene_type:complete